jgi:hypothetical protein
MRKICKLFFFVSSLIILASCDGDVINAGASTLDETDDIRVLSDTFPLTSSLEACSAISLTPDSFLLGECETHFGNLRADILTQLACPEGFEYPSIETAVIDSVCLYLYYRTWYGDGKSPLGITVYEMDKSTLPSSILNLDSLKLDDYCSMDAKSKVISSSHVIIPAIRTDSAYLSASQTYISCVRMRLTDDFAKRFFQARDFSSQEAFNNQFKGLYIRTDFGGSSVLYISDIVMTAYYHFTMARPGVEDSVIYDAKAFYANEEVRQVNRYVYPDREAILQDYNNAPSAADTSYIVSPANIYTQLSVDWSSIHQQISDRCSTDDYRIYVNKANLTVDVIYSDSITDRPRDNWETPATYMMLIKKENFKDFFAKNETPTDTTAIVATLTATADSLSNISYTYTYDLSDMLTQQLHSDNQVETLDFMLVPVSVTTNTSTGSVTSVKQSQTISATRIRSANNPDYPMDIELVYSGFSKKY